MQREESQVVIETDISAHANNYSTGFFLRYRYTIQADGSVRLDTRVSPRGKLTHWLPKMGLQLQLPDAFHHLEWFGRGPFETYPDRKTGAKIGRYRTTVEEDYVPYIIPQDYGNKTDVRWLSVTDDSGAGLYITGDQLFQASAHPFRTDHLTRAQYTFQLRQDNTVTLNLDHAVSGVGDTSASLLNPYRVLPGEAAFTFYLHPR